MTIDPQGTVSSRSTVLIDTSSTSSNNPLDAPQGMPASVPADQLYFWTEEWQADEARAADDIAAGRVRWFASAGDAIKYLLSVQR